MKAISFRPIKLTSVGYRRALHVITISTSKLRRSSFHDGQILGLKKRKDFFSSNTALNIPPQDPRDEQQIASSKRKTTRTSAAKNSLRRVAVEAQRSRDGKVDKRLQTGSLVTGSKTVTAICAAEEYDISHVARILQSFGHDLDPYKTELFPQVVHAVLPVQTSSPDSDETTWRTGDLFVFPSGTIVAWGLPDHVTSSIVSKALLPAAIYPLGKVEEEDLEYTEDSKRDNSSIKGDTIILGTRQPVHSGVEDGASVETTSESTQHRDLDSALAKIAFSSGLARSTKLAVLESLLSDYFESTRSIPAVLARGGRMPFSRSFISQKTGQLLSIRAQLNLYSELTDSLPDLFWDSRHELGLEGYYDQVSKALDTNIRIKVLNEKMDYAQEIASVLRQQLSEKHGIRLEWIIILLIAVEVSFAVEQEIKAYRKRS